MSRHLSFSSIHSGTTRWLGLLGAVPLPTCSAEHAVVWEGETGEGPASGRMGTGPPGAKESTGPPATCEGTPVGIGKAA